MKSRIVVTLAAIALTLYLQLTPGIQPFWWGPTVVAWIVAAREWAGALP
jgi:hypothetical protein